MRKFPAHIPSQELQCSFTDWNSFEVSAHRGPVGRSVGPAYLPTTPIHIYVPIYIPMLGTCLLYSPGHSPIISRSGLAAGQGRAEESLLASSSEVVKRTSLRKLYI